MAKEIKFNIKLLIDDKEQLVTASTSAKELRDNLDAAKSSVAKFRRKAADQAQSVQEHHTQSSIHKYMMIKDCNYFAIEGEVNTICYDGQTRRSMKREATARRYGLKVEAADSCRSHCK